VDKSEPLAPLLSRADLDYVVYKLDARRLNLYTTPIMYVRWQSRERRHRAFGRSGGPDVHWRAILVECERIKGKPTQRHIAYIGGITESAIAIVHQRCWFWDAVKEQLDRLGKRVTPEERRSIETAIAKKVPRPTKTQYRRCVRDRDALFAGLKRVAG